MKVKLLLLLILAAPAPLFPATVQRDYAPHVPTGELVAPSIPAPRAPRWQWVNLLPLWLWRL